MKILFDRKVCQVADNSLNQIESSLAKVENDFDTTPHWKTKNENSIWPINWVKG